MVVVAGVYDNESSCVGVAGGEGGKLLLVLARARGMQMRFLLLWCYCRLPVYMIKKNVIY